jgi:RimJ/RimL family protein N-acetyltransferase
METKLVEATDSDYEWMIRGAPRTNHGLRLPPGGVDEPFVLGHVRAIATRLRNENRRGTWMIVSGGEVVGLCGFKHPPSTDGAVEIGYGVATSRRLRGHATRAVAAILEIAKRDSSVRIVKAETNVANFASHRVLERNGFARAGNRRDAIDGEELILWQVRL